MLKFELPTVDPTERAAEDLILPDPLNLTFEGFKPEAFAILERLRQHPHIEQYQKEKPGITRYLKEPFKRFRDDLVVNWVLPNRLDYETERNVFSRLLKNDFGAGGCHHHLWMAFYRPGLKRLTDLQLSHSISPDAFTSGLYVGDYGKKLLRRAQEQIEQAPVVFLDLVNPLLEQKGWQFSFYYGSGDDKTRPRFDEPLTAVPDDLSKAKGIWMRRLFPRDAVLAWKGALVRHALDGVLHLWPLYRFFAGSRSV